jgi:hypothetical protein
MHRCHLAALMAATIGAGPVLGQSPAPNHVTVRVYDPHGVITESGLSSLDAAARTLGRASVRVTWRVCPRESCRDPLVPGELTLRLWQKGGPTTPIDAAALGDALVDTAAGVGLMATVYVDRVRWLALRSQTAYGPLLGHAIAHELGHLLLATIGHAADGLMRARFQPHELRRNRERDWAFTAAEAAAIAARLRTREGDPAESRPLALAADLR